LDNKNSSGVERWEYHNWAMKPRFAGRLYRLDVRCLAPGQAGVAGVQGWELQPLIAKKRVFGTNLAQGRSKTW